ncbi:MAG: phosphatase PAP2 family protein [Acidimicrobiales bacterium]
MSSRVVDLARNIAVLGGLYLAYAFVRRITADDHTTAFGNAARLLDFQNAIGLPSETMLQYPFLRHPEIITAANTFYMWVHFPFTAAFLAWAWFRHPRHFGVIRASLIILTTAGLVLHLIFPLAPPRMLKSVGYIDTGAVFGPSPYDLAASSAANQIAAMPSLHVGWALLIAISVIALSRSRFRYLILAHPIITTMVVVVTANHYWTDAIIAALLVAGSWLFMVRLRNLPVLHFDLHHHDPQPPPPARVDLVALEQAAKMGVEDLAEFAGASSVGVDR